MHRLLLTTDRGGTCEQARLAFAVSLLDSLKHRLVVQLGVPVVHGKLR